MEEPLARASLYQAGRASDGSTDMIILGETVVTGTRGWQAPVADIEVIQTLTFRARRD